MTKLINLKQNTSIQIGPKVSLVEISDIKNLKEVWDMSKKKKIRVHVLGEGTNSYFSNNLQKYLILKLTLEQLVNFNKLRDKMVVSATANVNWHTLVKETIKHKLWGLENLSYIPGSVGASPVQNIGAYGSEIKDNFLECLVFDLKDGKLKKLRNKDCKFSYRHSVFKEKPNRFIILSVSFLLSKKRNPILSYKPLNSFHKNTVTLEQIHKTVISTRKEKLPNYHTFPNCGSFFKNPRISDVKLKQLQKKYPGIVSFKEGKENKVAIAWVIENVIKMKGVQIGNFSTFKNHSLVIVNHKGRGTAKELNSFVKKLQNEIWKKTGLYVEQEVNYIS